MKVKKTFLNIRKIKEKNDIDIELGVKYAKRFAIADKNDRLFYTAGSSDCTNFVSQCLWASLGGYDYNDDHKTAENIKLKKNMSDGIWYGGLWGGTRAWENVEGLFRFLTNKNSLGILAEVINNGKPAAELNMDSIDIGNIIQVKKRGDARYHHSAYVTKTIEDNERRYIFVSQHSFDRLNRSLDELVASWGGDKECCIRVLKLKRYV